MVNCITRFIFRFYLDVRSYGRKILNSITFLFFSTVKNGTEWREKKTRTDSLRWMCIFIDSFTNDDVSHSLFDFHWSAPSYRTHIHTHTHTYPLHWHVYNFNPYFRESIVCFFLQFVIFTLLFSFDTLRWRLLNGLQGKSFQRYFISNSSNAIGSLIVPVYFVLLQLVAANHVSRFTLLRWSVVSRTNCTANEWQWLNVFTAQQTISTIIAISIFLLWWLWFLLQTVMQCHCYCCLHRRSHRCRISHLTKLAHSRKTFIVIAKFISKHKSVQLISFALTLSLPSRLLPPPPTPTPTSFFFSLFAVLFLRLHH